MTQNINDIIEEAKAKLSDRDNNHNAFLKQIPGYVANFVSRGIGVKVTSSEEVLRISAVFPSGIESKIVDYYPKDASSEFVRVDNPPDPYTVLVEAIVRGHEVTQRDRYLFPFAKKIINNMTDEGIVVDHPEFGRIILVGKEDVSFFREYFTKVNETEDVSFFREYVAQVKEADYLKRN